MKGKITKELIIKNVRQNFEKMGYGKKQQRCGWTGYIVGKKEMTVSEYQDYCIRKELKKFGIG